MTVLLPLSGSALGIVFASTGVVTFSFSTDLSRLAFVGDLARIVFAELPCGNLLGVPRTEELKFGRLGFEAIPRGVAKEGGGILPSLVLGRGALPIAEGGLDLVCIGLSGEKKLDLLLALAGEGGIRASVSIALSESEGRELFRNVGVSGVVPGEVAAVEHVFSP